MKLYHYVTDREREEKAYWKNQIAIVAMAFTMGLLVGMALDSYLTAKVVRAAQVFGG